MKLMPILFPNSKFIQYFILKKMHTLLLRYFRDHAVQQWIKNRYSKTCSELAVKLVVNLSHLIETMNNTVFSEDWPRADSISSRYSLFLCNSLTTENYRFINMLKSS